MTLTVNQRCKLAADYLCTLFKVTAPKRTLNLAINGINVVSEGERYAVVIGGEIAPYVVYTNEPWVNRPSKNPNENWIQNTIYSALPMLKIIFSGSYTTQEVRAIRRYMQSNSKDLQNQINARIAFIKANGLNK